MLKKNLDLYKERYATISKNQLKGLYIDIRIQCKNLMDDINEEKLIITDI